jgi:hypothetical protein
MKETYASNPDVDLSRSKYNFHIIEPADKYRKMSEALIKQYDCPRVRSDSVSNFSNKLARSSLRYREAIELADVLGYDLVWQKRKEGR